MPWKWKDHKCVDNVWTNAMIDMNITSLSYFFMLLNWIPLVSMLKLLLAMTIVAIMVKITILAILAMAPDVINMAILGFPVKEHKKLTYWYKIHFDLTFRLDIINSFVILYFSRHFFQCKNADSLRQMRTNWYIQWPHFFDKSFSGLVKEPHIAWGFWLFNQS